MPAAKPSIEHPKPIINDVSSAMDDVVCTLERVRGTFASASSDLMEQVANATPDRQPYAVQRAYDIWMVLMTAEQALERVYEEIAQINEALPDRLAKRREARA